jgi:glutaredoxin
MKNIYTFIPLTKWNEDNNCRYCPWRLGNKAVCELRTRNKTTNILLGQNFICLECKTKFENNELPKCPDCEKVYRVIDFYNNKYNCDCIDIKEREKEIKIDPNFETVQLEKQIESLKTEKEQVQEALETEQEAHLEAVDATADWYKRIFQEEKQELLNRISDLEKEKQTWDKANILFKNQIEELKKENKKLCNKILYSELIKSLNTTKLVTQIEIDVIASKSVPLVKSNWN